MKQALVFGASGFVGSSLLEILLNDPAYETVTVVVRRPLSVKHPKLTVITGDFSTLPGLKQQLVAEEVFIALGTTRKNTPDQKLYYQVDHDYPVLAARLARDNGAKSVFVVSAIGADAGSKTFYIRTKGEMERDIISLHYDHTHIFSPSMILGQRSENRPFEKALIGLFRVINPLFIGRANRFRGIEGKDIALAMVRSAGKTAGDVIFYQWKEMKRLSD